MVTTIKRSFAWQKSDGSHDNRPIGKINLSDKARITPDNPNGWLEPPKTWPTVYLPRTLKTLDRLGAGSVAVWDSEGSDGETYRGSPDTADISDGYLDNLYRAFRQAGYKVGSLIRGEEWDAATKTLKPSADPLWTMLRKMSYAKKRWGCKLFYIDTNLWNWRVTGELLPASMFAALRKALPGTLFMPEHPVTPGGDYNDPKTFWRAVDYWRDTAPYLELRNKHTDTPARIREVVTDAFSVINVTSSAKLVSDNADALREAVRLGTALMLDAHDDNECVPEVCEIMNG